MEFRRDLFEKTVESFYELSSLAPQPNSTSYINFLCGAGDLLFEAYEKQIPRSATK